MCSASATAMPNDVVTITPNDDTNSNIISSNTVTVTSTDLTTNATRYSTKSNTSITQTPTSWTTPIGLLRLSSLMLLIRR